MKKENFLSSEAARYDSFININSVNTHVSGTGRGIPVVCVHGFMGTAYDWRFNIAELGRHFAVRAFDLPGFGYSDKPLDFDYTSKGYAAFVKSFLDTCNIERAVLVGNSLGGQIALKTCQEYPERVSALILIDSGGYPGCVQFPLFRMLKIPVIGRVTMALVTRSATRYILNQILVNRSLITDDIVTYYYNVYKTVNAKKVPPMVIRNVVKDEADIKAGLKEIKCPTLIIWGACDKVIPGCYGQLFKADILQSTLLTIQQAGHMPQIDRPAEVNNAVIDFIIQNLDAANP